MVSHYPDESLRDFHIKSTFGRFVAGKDIQLIDSDSVNLKLIFRRFALELRKAVNI